MRVRENSISALALALLLPVPALAQETGDMPPPAPTEEPAGTSGHDVYTPEDFARFAPKTALDMTWNSAAMSISNSGLAG